MYSREKRHEEALDLRRTALRRREERRTNTFQYEGNVAAARVSLAFYAVATAQDAPLPHRSAWMAEAEKALRRAAPFVEQLGTENLSISLRALRATFLDVRARLLKLSEPPSPAR